MNDLRTLNQPVVLFGVFAVIFCGYIIAANPLFFFPDSPWHLAAGDLIRASGGLPAYDAWSYTAGETRWFHQSWGFDVIISIIRQYLGLPGLYILTYGLGALVLVLVWKNILLRDVTARGLIAAWLLAAIALFPRVGLKPDMISYLLVVVFYIFLHRSRENIKYAYALPLLMVIWVNVHGGFLAGLILITIYFIEAILKKENQRIRHFMMIGLGCGLAILVNPLGIHILPAILANVNSQIIAQLGEWKPLSASQFPFVFMAMFVMVLVTNIRNHKIPLADKVVAYIWLVMGIDSTRFSMYFGILAAPYIAQCMKDLEPDNIRIHVPTQ
ncbi:MAG: hypothetical protein KDD76_07020, partial [Rickettsiales bacterium]|nr:hypothetical protein [Rickettsiales bacterium]